jgi:hypothetical protein
MYLRQLAASRTLAATSQVVRNYAAKDITFSTEARARLLRGVNKLADAVAVTMGPKVLISKFTSLTSHRAAMFSLSNPSVAPKSPRTV